jgi:hypothetical protein
MVALVHAASGALSPAPASTPVSSAIVVVVPAAATAPLREALSRLRGEAESVGFAIHLVEAPAGVDPPGQLAQVAAIMSPASVVALVEPAQGPPLGAIDVWFLDRTSGKTSVGHLLVEDEAGDRAELVLAVRVVDFIRARMFDSLVRSSAKKPSTPVPRHEAVGAHFVAVGIATTGSFSGLSASLMPSVQAGYGVRSWLHVIVGGAGFGTKPSRETTAGSATVDEKLLVLGAKLRARTWWRFFPAATAGLSTLFMSVHGEGKPGYLGHEGSAWSPGLFASAGMGVVIASHVQLFISGGGTLLLRQPKVFINDVEVARTGRPAWLADALLGVSF